MFIKRTVTKQEMNFSFPVCNSSFCYSLFNQHGIAKTKETIFFFYRSFIGMQHMLPSCQCRYQHHKCRLWQMKVCNQRINYLKLIARINKNLCPATGLLQMSIFISNVRVLVVPTAITRCPFSFARLILSAASCDTI